MEPRKNVFQFCIHCMTFVIIWVRFPYVHLTIQIFILNNLFCLFIFNCDFYIFLKSILMVIISLELTRVNPDRNIFLINVELASTLFTLQRFGPSPSPNFKAFIIYHIEISYVKCKISLIIYKLTRFSIGISSNISRISGKYPPLSSAAVPTRLRLSR